MRTILVFIECTGHGRRGPVYVARLHQPDGQILVTGSTQPALDAARELIARHHDRSASVEIWDTVHPFPRMIGTVGRWAELTVAESENGNAPRLRSYRPYDARQGMPVSTRTAISGWGATPIAPDLPGPVATRVA